MASTLATKNECNFEMLVNIIKGLNIESIVNINFTHKINMFRTLVLDCLKEENEIDFYLNREDLNGQNLRFRIMKLSLELGELLRNQIASYVITSYNLNLILYDFKQQKKRLQSHILEDPEFIKAQQIIINQISQGDRFKKTSPKKRPTLVQRARKKLRKEWEERRKLEKKDLTKQQDKIKKLLSDKIKMEKELRKNITDHMKETGNKRDYTEKLAGKLLNYYYELSYPDPSDFGRAGMLTRIKLTISQWISTLDRIVVQIKNWDEVRRAQENARELLEQETTEEIEREMAKILRQKKKEQRANEKEIQKKIKKLEQLKAKQKSNSAKKIQRAFRHTRKKPTRTSEQPNETKQPSLQPIDNVDRSIIERIKELYGYLMEKKIFKTYREKRERILTVMIPYHRHLLQFMKERLIPQLEDKKIRVVVTGGFATALLTGNYKTEDVDMKLYLIRETEENNANFKMRDIVKAILEENLDFLNVNQEELSYRIYEPSRNPLENNGDIPVKITGRINEEKEGKRENPRVPGDYDAVGELTFSATEYNGNLIDVEGIPVLSPEILIDNLLNHASNNFRERMESGERNIYPEKLLGWMKQLQALLRLKNPDAANELSKEIDRMKSPSPKEGGKRKKKRKTRKKRRKKKKTKRKRKKNRKKRTRRK